ncbi:glyceraldehyde-3-phosphate dehydrogenase (NAD+) [Desulfonispora thiosulfatigenes DSM 11270]|uniref:Glyceraldehyde-3-phosphate dehydrogenase n=1 Tax=Desulfonispora thiosulfatigenes DSM 11270 TaxID=656914 RepID=A0A1W1UUG7_DESTI|nr:glyceraldehyde-3-phosphate dehydrogenase [Desulfonispora thiosulfatigenes]SMB84639.1 glyceraldehyde-3-phosphate dehydrogenase (NAD+) [Desulfonispora thiosulfatigenes DSM 11270]
MVTRIAINGFGRIGRLCLREAIKRSDLEVVAVNSTGDPKTSAHLLKYDSTHGIYDGEIKYTDNSLIIDGKEVKLLSDRDPSKMPWKDLKIDIVLEATGKFNSKEAASVHLEAGAKKVVISAPAKNADATIVMGVNEDSYDAEKHTIISNASCTTNCLAPIVKVLHDNLTIKTGLMTTVHAFTNDQKNLDNRHKDLRRARGCVQSIIPTTTGAAAAVTLVIPELEGKLNGMALRVPTPDVSLVDLVVEFEEKITKENINDLLKEASLTNMKNVMAYCDEPLVSIDFTGNPHSTIIDALSTMVVGDYTAKIIAWYDNEWGYSCRVIDLVSHVGQQLCSANARLAV